MTASAAQRAEWEASRRRNEYLDAVEVLHQRWRAARGDRAVQRVVEREQAALLRAYERGQR